MRLGRGFTKDRSWSDWLWLTLGLVCIGVGLTKSLKHGSVYGAMLDEFHWAQLAQSRLKDGSETVLAGYMLPLPSVTDGDREPITKFILVPYLPSCTQRPPPLANQTVLVETAPIKFSTDPVVVRGALTLLPSSVEGAGYEMKAQGLRPWSHGQFAQKDED